jgi:hypothetical protein
MSFIYWVNSDGEDNPGSKTTQYSASLPAAETDPNEDFD